jgi:hypothetical protein
VSPCTVSPVHPLPHYHITSSHANRIDGTSAATSQKMVCQSTCVDYATSEGQVVNNTYGNFCPGADNTNGGRAATLRKDFVDCTDWTTLTTNNSESCVSGEDNGENNCGFGTSTVQLCGFCSGDSPDSCCYACKSGLRGCAVPKLTDSQYRCLGLWFRTSTSGQH